MVDDPTEPVSPDLFDLLPCGVLVTDVKGMILRANRTICAWLAVEMTDLIGQKKVQDFFTMGGRIFHQTHWQPALQMQGSLAEVKFDVRRSDGAILPMMVNAVRTRQGSDTVDIISLTVAEERNKYERELLAARKRADDLVDKERALQHAMEDRALFAEQMIGIVSHDLRNPLTVISMGATYLDRKAEVSPATRAKLLKSVISSAQSAQRLIGDLLDFTVARVGRGLSVNRSPVDFHALVQGAVETLAVAFPGRVLEHVSRGAGPCLADADRIGQLLGNLVGNAMAYGEADRPVTVVSEIDETLATLAVHNFGVAIAPALVEKMFEPMVRGGPSERSTRSVGLGLYIVKAIASVHDGNVAVESLAGVTTFTFSFPRV